MRLGMPDLDRTDVHVLLMLFEAKSAVGEGDDAHHDQDDADNASWFHDWLSKLRAGRRRD